MYFKLYFALWFCKDLCALIFFLLAPEQDFCKNNPCLNGATCTGTTCHCPVNYSGRYCEKGNSHNEYNNNDYYCYYYYYYF